MLEWDDDNGPTSGSAYVFDLREPAVTPFGGGCIPGGSGAAPAAALAALFLALMRGKRSSL